MPIRRIKAQSPDPYLGKIKGDTELARLAHLNYVIDEINNGAGGGGGSITVNGASPVTNLSIGFASGSTIEGYDPNSDTYFITYVPEVYDPGYKAYRAKIAMESVAWSGYGYLYNWYAVTDARKLENPSGGTGLTAPNQWRVPSETDWNTLIAFFGGTTEASKMKSKLTSTAYPFYGWVDNSIVATDDYNFSVLPGGLRSISGSFVGIGASAFFWSSTIDNPISNSSISYGTTNNLFGGQFFNGGPSSNASGFSVRLVREATAGELLLADGDTSDTSSLDPYTGNDGKTYVTVKIGTQIWLAQNLRETKYNDNSNIFNAASGVYFSGGDGSDSTWQAKGIAQEGAWTAYLFNPGSGSVVVDYNPSIIRLFYNDVLENTFGEDLIWVVTLPCPSCFPTYNLVKQSLQSFKKTHIKITPGYDVNNLPTINERSLLVERAVEGEGQMGFIPIKKDGTTGAITIEDLNNYPGSPVSYVYVEILEYGSTTPYYGSGLSVALGASNLEDEEEIVALTYEINGVTYTEDLEAKKLSIEIAKIYDQLGIFDKYKV